MVLLAQRHAHRARRFGEAAVLVGVWICLGVALRPGPNGYLLYGIPLTLAFQRFVRRRPVEDLWVRDGSAFDRRWLKAVAAIAAVATAVLFVLARSQAALALWLVAALVGAIGAVYSVRHGSRATVRDAALCLGIGGSLDVAILIVAAVSEGLSGRSAGTRTVIAVLSLPLFFCVSFVLEEVTFRGAIDSHVQHPGERLGLLTAVAVSAMWGLWHLPLTDGRVATEVVRLLVVHVPVGIVLSVFWRRSGNLAVPAFTHAFLNAIRDALFV